MVALRGRGRGFESKRFIVKHKNKALAILWPETIIILYVKGN